MAARATEIRIEGLADLEQKLKLLSSQAQGQALLQAVSPGSLEVASTARQLAPKDTEAMANSIGARVAKVERTHADIEVGPSDEIYYARFQELGTKHNAAHPFLRPALDERKESVVAHAAEWLRRIVLSVATAGGPE